MSNTINMNVSSSGKGKIGTLLQGDNNNVVIAAEINGSLNQAKKSGAGEALIKSLEELHKTVGEMCKNLSEPKQRVVAKDLETFSSEIVSKAPRKEWYELSAKGLIEAAKTVGEIAAPVIKAVNTVLGLL